MSYYITTIVYSSGAANIWYSDVADFEVGKGWKLTRVWRKPQDEYNPWTVRESDIVYVSAPCVVQRIEQEAPWMRPVPPRPKPKEEPPPSPDAPIPDAVVTHRPRRRPPRSAEPSAGPAPLPQKYDERPEGWQAWPS